MTLEWHGDEAKRRNREAAARGLLATAVFFLAQHKQRLNTSNPRPHDTPSRRGEYLRKRTGFAQANVLYLPTTVTAVAKDLIVRLGYGRNAFYALWWEIYGGRLGLRETLKLIRPQLAAFASVAARGGSGEAGGGVRQ